MGTTAAVVATHRLPTSAARPPQRLLKSAASTAGEVHRIEPLRLGSVGQRVQQVQRMLNRYLVPAPSLVIDGTYGPVTAKAVATYQAALRLLVDGIVGKETWFHLLKGVEGRSSDSPAVMARAPRMASPYGTGALRSPLEAVSTPVLPVHEWTMEQRFSEVLRRTTPLLPQHMRREFAVLLSPMTLSIIGGTLVVWAGAHAFGVGQVVDVVLLVGGLAMLGLAVFDVASYLGNFLVLTATADGDQDLQEAAENLARAIALIGVAAFLALLAKVARPALGSGRKGRAPAPEVAPPPHSPRAKRAVPPPPVTSRASVESQPRPHARTKVADDLDEMYTRAPAAKAEIDDIADRIATQTGGSVAKAPIKGKVRALQKAEEYAQKGGGAANLKDLARNTIVVERSQFDKAVGLLKAEGASVKVIDAAADPMGYSGANSSLKTQSGLFAEIQVNTPEMIYAKEKPEIARAILGEARYSSLAGKVGVPGGQGHHLYEEWRVLSPGDAKAASLAEESRAYYDLVRFKGGH